MNCSSADTLALKSVYLLQLLMPFPVVPDVYSMYQALFPGGGTVSEAISTLRNSYLFLSTQVDPEEGGRALVLALFSLTLTIVIMVQRRLGNVKSLVITFASILAMHGSMLTLFGLPWLVVPAMNFFWKSRSSSGLAMVMSLVSMVIGWQKECAPPTGFKHWGWGDEDRSPWTWGVAYFGIFSLSFGISLARCRINTSRLLNLSLGVEIITFKLFIH